MDELTTSLAYELLTSVIRGYLPQDHRRLDWEATCTPRIVQEYATLRDDEKVLLQSCVQTFLQEYPDSQETQRELVEVACMAGLSTKSMHEPSLRLLGWLAQRVRGYNRELQRSSHEYLDWVHKSLKVADYAPEGLLKQWQMQPALRASLSSTLLAFSRIVLAETISEEAWTTRFASMNDAQALTLLDYCIEQYRNGIDTQFIGLFEQHHPRTLRKRLSYIISDNKLIQAVDPHSFKDAGDEIRDQLIGQLRDGSRWGERMSPTGEIQDLLSRLSRQLHPLPFLLRALAWMKDEVVARAFQQLAEETWWKGHAGDPLSYPEDAGWHLTADGKIHDLCSEVHFELVPASSDEPDFTFGKRSNRCCPQCRTTLIETIPGSVIRNQFTIPFDQGQSLLWCPQCWESTMIDWNDAEAYAPNRTLKVTNVDIEPTSFKLGQRGVAQPPDWRSRLGGHPYWIQETAYPRCMRCTQPMFFLGQIDNDVGMVYSFACKDCRVTATTAQCS